MRPECGVAEVITKDGTRYYAWAMFEGRYLNDRDRRWRWRAKRDCRRLCRRLSAGGGVP